MNEFLGDNTGLLSQLMDSVEIAYEAIEFIIADLPKGLTQLPVLKELILQIYNTAQVIEEKYPKVSTAIRCINILDVLEGINMDSLEVSDLFYIQKLLTECEKDLKKWSLSIISNPIEYPKILLDGLINSLSSDEHKIQNDSSYSLALIIESNLSCANDILFELKNIKNVQKIVYIAPDNKDSKEISISADEFVLRRKGVKRDLILQEYVRSNYIAIVKSDICISSNIWDNILSLISSLNDECVNVRVSTHTDFNLKRTCYIDGDIILFPTYMLTSYLLSKEIASHFQIEAFSSILRRSGKHILTCDCGVADQQDQYRSCGNNLDEISIEKRMEYRTVFEIDPYDNDIFTEINPKFYPLKTNNTETIQILALNCGICGTPLQFKNYLHEQGYTDVILYGVCLSDAFVRYEMNGVCDFVLDARTWYSAAEQLKGLEFDYIFIGNFPVINRFWSILPEIKEMLKEHGNLFARNLIGSEIEEFKDMFRYEHQQKKWHVFSGVQKVQVETRGISLGYFSGCRMDLINLLNIEFKHDESFRVLEVGCGAGATLAWLKKEYPNCNTYGIEINPYAAETARKRVDFLSVCDCEDSELPGVDECFDYIICGDVIEHLVEPWKLVKRLYNRLKLGGRIAASLPNVQHWSVILDLIQGNWTYSDAGLLDRTHLRFFTINTAIQLFQSNGFEVENISANVVPCQYSKVVLPNEEEARVKMGLEQLYEHNWLGEKINYDVHQCLIVAKKIIR